MVKRVISSIVGIGLVLGVVAIGALHRMDSVARLLMQAEAAYNRQDYGEAVPIYQRLAKRGNSIAQRMLGQCYMYGFGVEQSDEEAVKHLLPVAEEGDMWAQAGLASCYLRLEKPFDEVYSWLQKASIQGEESANLCLGLFYAEGYGVKQSHETACDYFLKAASAGNAHAQYLLGIHYEGGLGVERSHEQALAWYEKAATNGHLDAQTTLGQIYLSKEQNEEGVKWTRLAAEAGEAVAQVNLAICYQTGQGVEQSDAEAIRWTQKAAEQGNVEALYNLAYCYAEGDGLEHSMEKAFELWKQIDDRYMDDLETGRATVSEQFAIPTMYNLGLCYLYGDGVQQNPITAYIYIRGAAKAGHSKAQRVLKEVWNEHPDDPLINADTLQELRDEQSQ